MASTNSPLHIVPETTLFMTALHTLCTGLHLRTGFGSSHGSFHAWYVQHEKLISVAACCTQVGGRTTQEEGGFWKIFDYKVVHIFVPSNSCSMPFYAQLKARKMIRIIENSHVSRSSKLQMNFLTEGFLRIASCLPYILPMMDSLAYGRFSKPQTFLHQGLRFFSFEQWPPSAVVLPTNLCN
jgi:hypothetical protein